MTDIYTRHDKAFANITAAAILHDGKHVANVTLKHGAEVTAYVHWLGTDMTSGRARGGGYDRATAAVAVAARKHCDNLTEMHPTMAARSFWATLEADGVHRWSVALRHAGFTVCNVIA